MQVIPPISASHNEHFVPFFAVTESANIIKNILNYKRVVIDSIPCGFILTILRIKRNLDRYET